MIYFSKPCDQGRFNATVYELLRMNYAGGVSIEGNWDIPATLTYLESRLNVSVLPTLKEDGSLFQFQNKYVLFMPSSVLVTTNVADITTLA